MALFTDGTIPTMDDLTAEDSSLLDVAGSEGIDVTRKLAATRDELGVELDAQLARLSGTEPAMWRPAVNIQNVVVTAPLKLWHTYRTLELVYRDAYSSQLNDRYKAKRDQYHGLAAWAFDKLQQTGAGIAQSPVPQPAQPVVQLTPGGLTDGTYFVTMAWANAAGEEGASAAPVMVATLTGTGFTVRAPAAPQAAAGWNIYAGPTAESMTRQNAVRLLADETWTQLTAPRSDGQHAGSGQAPTYLRPLPRILQRG